MDTPTAADLGLYFPDSERRITAPAGDQGKTHAADHG